MEYFGEPVLTAPMPDSIDPLDVHDVSLWLKMLQKYSFKVSFLGLQQFFLWFAHEGKIEYFIGLCLEQTHL